MVVLGAGEPSDRNYIPLATRDGSLISVKGRARLVFESPSHEPLFQKEYEIDLSSFLRTRVRSTVSFLPVPESGWYRFIDLV
jgi:hypothetical protein